MQRAVMMRVMYQTNILRDNLENDNARRYYGRVITSFSDKEAEKLFNRERSKRLPHDIQLPARRKLELLHAAASIRDLRAPPSNRLEKLKGDRSDFYSIRINDQWRICFRWDARGASEVEKVDYH